MRTSGLQNGHVETAKLHCGQPGRVKRLDRIAAIVSGAHPQFTVTVKYRVDDATTWTTAGSSSDTRLVAADVMGVEFYTVQVRIEVADASGSHLDYAVEDVSVVYTLET